MIIGFLHQKGGTGKSSLAIAAAVGLAARGARVLLLDADYQGTSSDWGNAYGAAFGVEVRAQVQPVLHEQRAALAREAEWVLVDGPPSLSPMTESIVRASDRVIIPLRPAMPDVWALPWLAALIGKLRREGAAPQAMAVFNQMQGEDVAPLAAELARWDLPLAPEPLPMHPAFLALFRGEALPEELSRKVLALLGV